MERELKMIKKICLFFAVVALGGFVLTSSVYAQSSIDAGSSARSCAESPDPCVTEIEGLNKCVKCYYEDTSVSPYKKYLGQYCVPKADPLPSDAEDQAIERVRKNCENSTSLSTKL